MLKVKTNKKELNYKLIIISKKKTTYSKKVFNNLANFNSKVIQLDINLYIYWLNKNIHLTSKTKRFINSNQIISKNYIKFMYKFKKHGKI
jgi:hypothetical protein